MKLTYPCLFLFVSGAAACSGSDALSDAGSIAADVSGDAGASSDGGADDAGVQTLGERIAAAACTRELECCPGNSADCSTLATVVDGLFEREGVQVDAARVDACVMAIANNSCDAVAAYGGTVPLPQVCPDLTEGTLPDGAACGGLFGDDQCVSGNCRDGACSPLGQDGEACSPGSCGAGLRCSLGVCRVPTGPDASCEDTSVCVDGYACYRKPNDMDAMCHAEVEVGPGEECVPGTVCSLGRDACRCPPGIQGCLNGFCGDRSRCL